MPEVEEDRAGISGPAGLAGHEYQIDVSVGSSLHLMVASKLTHEMTLEPVSNEDLEADLEENEPGHVIGEMQVGSYRLIVQAKLRSGRMGRRGRRYMERKSPQTLLAWFNFGRRTMPASD